ncbi:hypothetical protein AAG906_038939 [Vitis piasezkii]|uniref:Uncharacterized protein n=1 Tax=Vitis vinifera TaxID=29760 RepID=A0A438I7V5_VITVI|nr:hypothetical protein CK203_042542 [Vitis vinifera]
MKSDDEWITELEDPCLPKDNSWMDVHECFQVNEGCNGKRKQVEEDDDKEVIEVEDNEEEYNNDDMGGDDEDDIDINVDY